MGELLTQEQMKTMDLSYYTDILEKNYHITDMDLQKEYLEYCIDVVKNNIIYLHDNKYPIKDVLNELFKRAMVKKWVELHQK